MLTLKLKHLFVLKIDLIMFRKNATIQIQKLHLLFDNDSIIYFFDHNILSLLLVNRACCYDFCCNYFFAFDAYLVISSFLTNTYVTFAFPFD